MRRVLQRIVLAAEHTALDIPRLLADRDHRLAEAVELRLRLRLRGLDHQRAGHGEAHGRRVEAVVHEALRDVLHLDTCGRLERTRVDDALMCHAAVLPLVEHLVVPLQLVRDVVRVEDRDLGGLGEALTAHHVDVHHRDRENACAAPGCRRHRANALHSTRGNHAVGRQEGREVRHHADRAHAGAAPAMRDAEGLVEVQVADVRADVARAAEPDHRVHVRAVEIDLAAMLVNDGADILDALLEHAMRARIRHHERRQVGRMLLGLRLQVGDVDVPVRVGLHDNHLHADHDRARRVRAVRRLRDQTDATMPLLARLVIRADHEKSRVLALRSGIGLQ